MMTYTNHQLLSFSHFELTRIRDLRLHSIYILLATITIDPTAYAAEQGNQVPVATYISDSVIQIKCDSDNTTNAFYVYHGTNGTDFPNFLGTVTEWITIAGTPERHIGYYCHSSPQTNNNFYKVVEVFNMGMSTDPRAMNAPVALRNSDVEIVDLKRQGNKLWYVWEDAYATDGTELCGTGQDGVYIIANHNDDNEEQQYMFDGPDILSTADLLYICVYGRRKTTDTPDVTVNLLLPSTASPVSQPLHFTTSFQWRTVEYARQGTWDITALEDIEFGFETGTIPSGGGIEIDDVYALLVDLP